MRITPIVNNVCFKGNIIDSHMHMGQWGDKKYAVQDIDKFIKNPLSNGDVVQKAVVSSASCLSNPSQFGEIKGNLEMLEFASKNPKIGALAVCEPQIGSVNNMRKLFSEHPNKFIGLKFHPDCHQIMANDNRVIPYLKFAQEKKLPCVFHCGIPWDEAKGGLVDEAKRFSSPEHVYEAAKKIPDTPVVMAHYGAGGNLVHAKAKDAFLSSLKKQDALLYTDISWVDIDNVDKPNIIDLIKEAKKNSGLNRIMFGSDAPIAEFDYGKNGLSGKEFYEKTVVDIKSAIKKNFGDEAEEIIDKIFYKNADDLFFKKIEPIKKSSPALAALAFGGGALALSLLAYKFLDKK